MKINSITMNTGYLKGKAPEQSKYRNSEYLCKYDNNNDKINTTIRNNSDGRASFKGGKVPFLHTAANFASANPLVAEAVFALFITCGLRPLAIMATAKTDEDKEKCSYQAAKSISSGVVGLVLTAVIGTAIAAAAGKSLNAKSFKIPEEVKANSQKAVKNGVEALKQTTEKLIQEGKETEFTTFVSKLIEDNKINLNVLKDAGKGAAAKFKEAVAKLAPDNFEQIMLAIKEQKVLDNYEKTAKNVIDKLFQPIFMPIRANITVALVPVILGILGLNKKKSQAKPKLEENPYKVLSDNVFKGNCGKNDIFKVFTEGN